MKKIASIVVIAAALTACSEQLDIPVTTHTVDATNVMLVNRIDSMTREGDVVRLKKINSQDCSAVGTITKDFSIAIYSVECGDKVTLSRSSSGTIKLNRNHTFINADGKESAGYDTGDRFSLYEAGIDFDKLHDFMTSHSSKL